MRILRHQTSFPFPPPFRGKPEKCTRTSCGPRRKSCVLFGVLNTWLLGQLDMADSFHCSQNISHRIHGTGIFTYMNGGFLWFFMYIGQYTSPMDPVGDVNLKRQWLGSNQEPWREVVEILWKYYNWANESIIGSTSHLGCPHQDYYIFRRGILTNLHFPPLLGGRFNLNLNSRNFVEYSLTQPSFGVTLAEVAIIFSGNMSI